MPQSPLFSPFFKLPCIKIHWLQSACRKRTQLWITSKVFKVIKDKNGKSPFRKPQYNNWCSRGSSKKAKTMKWKAAGNRIFSWWQNITTQMTNFNGKINDCQGEIWWSARSPMIKLYITGSGVGWHQWLCMYCRAKFTRFPVMSSCPKGFHLDVI